MSGHEGTQRYAWQRHPVFRVVASTPLGIVLIIAVAVVLVWGTIVDARSGLSVALHTTYGAVWFQALLGLLVVSLVCCVLKAMPFRWSHVGFIVTHASLLLVYAGAMLTIHFGAQGVVRIVEGATTGFYFEPAFVTCSDAARGESADLPTAFEKDAERLREQYTGEAGVQPVALGDITVAIVRYHPDPTPHGERAIRVRFEDSDGHEASAWVHAYGRVDVELGGRTLTIEYPKRVPLGFTLRLDEFVATQYPHSSIPAGYESHVAVQDGGGTTREIIAMNAPATIGGYTLYQSRFGTDPATRRPYTVLTLSRDPGTPVLYVGFGALLAGIIVTFYVSPALRRREQRQHEVPT